MKIAIEIVQIVMALFFIYTGSKIITGKMAEEFKRFGLPSFFNSMTGLFELIGAIGMFIGVWFPVFAIGSGALLGLTMLAAVFSLLVLGKDPFQKAIPALVLTILSGIVVWFNFTLM